MARYVIEVELGGNVRSSSIQNPEDQRRVVLHAVYDGLLRNLAWTERSSSETNELIIKVACVRGPVP